MTRRLRVLIFGVVLSALWGGALIAQEGQVPPSKIAELESALAATKKEGLSPSRTRLAVKRVIRDAGDLLKENAAAENRFELLGLMFQAQQRLFGLDDSSKNRAAVLETAKALLKAPDAHAEVRLEADLLLTQSELARSGADAKERLKVLKAMVARYRDTSGEAKMLRTAMIMALELGDSRIVRDLRKEMAERFASDFEMINFQRDKLGGQVFGAPFCGVFKRSDGGLMHLPADGLGRTLFLYFWSKENFGRKDLEGLATYWKAHRNEISGRVHIVSFNVDGLPDAGEQILRDLGVDWPALHLPGGRADLRYEIFAKRDHALVTVTPTGYAAIVMSGATRKRTGTAVGSRDYERWFQSLLAREWTDSRYTNQLTSLFGGDFLVCDPEGPFDLTRPPEVKGSGGSVKRNANSVPEKTLTEIQDCFVMPPLRYRMSLEEIRSSYRKVDKLCSKAISAHSGASDLWLVRNRRMVALMGLFKLTMERSYFDSAVNEAGLALGGDLPKGADIVARYILTKEALRQDEVKGTEVISDFVEGLGGVDTTGPTLAVASLLALDIADRSLHEEYRERILKDHCEEPMMWTFVSFLLDRYHRYWLYRVPFTAGWTYGRRSQVFMSLGNPDEVERSVEAELKTLDGKPYLIPAAGAGKWNVVLFTSNWSETGKAPVYSTVGRYLLPHFKKRGIEDVQVVVAVVGGDVAKVQRNLKEKPLECDVVMVPGGVENPLMKQFGVINEDERCNALVIRPDGKVAIFLSGLPMARSKGTVIQNVIEWHDREAVVTMLKEGELEKAKEMIWALAPPFDPEAVDEKGRKLKKPKISLSHLRARARVYLALKDYDKALADAEEVAVEQMRLEGWMSLRTDQLDEDEAFRDLVKEQKEKASK